MRYLVLLGFVVFVYACSSTKESSLADSDNYDLTLAFGSCNKQYKENVLWKEIIKQQPDAWIWGGDVIYSDTEDMNEKAADYAKLEEQKKYNQLKESTKILGVWDDHDYGVNDGGSEYPKKAESQRLFLDFLEVPDNDERRKREGIYHSEILTTQKGSVQIILLDTRYFRSALTPSDEKGKKYQPNNYEGATILGETQWKWLEEVLTNSDTDFNIIMSSIQVLSDEHGFETWGNFPREREKLFSLIRQSKSKGTLLLSGDRHISEFSKIELPELPYPLIEFTSSGLTHSKDFNGEDNAKRIGDVVSTISFGIVKFNFEASQLTLEMRGENNQLLQKISQAY